MHFRAILFIFFIFTQTELLADSYNEGLDAYNKQDFSKAYAIWKNIAKSDANVSSDFQWQTVGVAQKMNAQYGIALLYWLGNGREQDTEKSKYWLQLASDNGHPQATSKLGYLYLADKSVKGHAVKARHLFKKASAAGLSEAQYNLAILLLEGVGGKKSQKKATYWLKKASAQGNENAKEKLLVLATNKSRTTLFKREEKLASKNKPKVKATVKPALFSRNAKIENKLAKKITSKKVKFAIQIVVAKDPKGIERIIKKYPKINNWVSYKNPKNNIIALSLCCYRTRDQAKKAITQLPKGLRAFKPIAIEWKKDKVTNKPSGKSYKKTVSNLTEELIRNKTNFAIQIVVAKDPKGIERIIKKYPKIKNWVSYKNPKNKIIALSLCCYRTRDQAKKAVAQLPKGLRAFKPLAVEWKKTFIHKTHLKRR